MFDFVISKKTKGRVNQEISSKRTFYFLFKKRVFDFYNIIQK